MPTANEIRENVTNQIVEALQNGVAPWRRPWSINPCSGSPKNISGRSYSGVNPLLLTLASMKYGFTSRYWATFNQWRAIGACVKPRPSNVAPGKWGTTIVFSKPCQKKDKDGEEVDGTFWVLRSFVVFNADQVDGEAAEQFKVHEHATESIVPSYDDADRLIANTGADIRFGGDRAFYHLAEDYIQMPPKYRFTMGEFYPTVFHELTHWSESRLQWDRKSNGYAMSELLAELSSCFICSELDIPLTETLGNHAAYLQHWIDQMKGDSRYIFRISGMAARVSDYLLSFRPQLAEEEQFTIVA